MNTSIYNVCLIQETIPHYRIAIFELLAKAKDINLTIIHSGQKTNGKYNEIITHKIKFGSFKFLCRLNNYTKEADIIITPLDITFLNTIFILLNPLKTKKIILWGIGLGFKKLMSPLRAWIAKKADALCLYSERDLSYFHDNSPKQPIFITHNTLDIKKQYPLDVITHKRFLICIGTLNYRKRLDLVIDAFIQSLTSIPDDIQLIIIGTGEEKQRLIEKSRAYSHRIQFKDRITNEEALYQYFRKSIASISFGQAGLSVLHSFSFGVPCITSDTAISGGENLNVIRNKTGLISNQTNSELKKMLVDIINDSKKARFLSKNAYDHYWKKRTPKNMIQGFLKAIKIVTKNQT